MLIDRIFTPGLAQVTYLVADEAVGEVAVIDPRRDIDAYTEWAARRDYRITAILETHVHADFVSGARELGVATGAPIHASRLGNQDFPHVPVDDGDDIPIGELKLRALWTPGHTPEHMSYLFIAPADGNEPVALFSGDVLFVGEVGRPDLLGEGETQRLAEQLYHTVSDRLTRLNSALVVYPGHTAGSACGKKIGDAPFTTIGQENISNYAFQARTKEAFVRMVLNGMPQHPTYYPVLKRINQAGPPLISGLPGGDALTVEQVVEQQNGGSLVIDARSPDAFGGGHVPDAIFAGLGPNFLIWMGWLAPYDRDLILVLGDDGLFVETRDELRRIGLDRVAGYLDGGMAAWQAAGREIATLPQMSVHDLAHRYGGSGDGLVVLDVRSDDEWKDGHIANAVHRFAGEIVQGSDISVDGASHVAVICGSGYRSSVASSLLQARGARNLTNVIGGMAAWNEAKLPTTRATA